MKEENKKYAQEAFDIVTHAAKKSVPGFPALITKKSMPIIWAISSVKSV